jgi:polar amino acid transport system permease protein
MTVNCPNCGREIHEGDQFCGYCEAPTRWVPPRREEPVKKRESKLLPWTGRLEEVPWWALILLLLGLWFLYSIFNSEIYRDAFLFLVQGIKFTILITLAAFAISIVLGLVTAFGRVSKNPVIYTLASLYVEVIRGVPILVQLFYVAFVLTPVVVQLANGLGNFLLHQQYASFQFLVKIGTALAEWSIRDIDMMARAIIGLALAYGAFEAEVYRAGIQSIEKGQMEAARSLGMTYFQAMRYIILPQAIRRVLPPLGNDFIAMLKDSSLVSSLAVRELTQLAKLNRSRTFLTYPTWNTVSFLYLTMTILLSLLVQFMEKKMSID